MCRSGWSAEQELRIHLSLILLVINILTSSAWKEVLVSDASRGEHLSCLLLGELAPLWWLVFWVLAWKFLPPKIPEENTLGFSVTTPGWVTYWSAATPRAPARRGLWLSLLLQVGRAWPWAGSGAAAPLAPAICGQSRAVH